MHTTTVQLLLLVLLVLVLVLVCNCVLLLISQVWLQILQRATFRPGMKGLKVQA